MNKQVHLQFISLFQGISDFTNTETPEADTIDFIPIASERNLHKEMTHTLAGELSENLESTPPTTTTGVETPATPVN